MKTPQPKPQQLYLAKLAESGLDLKDAKAQGFELLTQAEAEKQGVPDPNGPVVKIPYYDLNGKLLKVARYRRLVTTVASGFLKGTTLSKYWQSGAGTEIYLPLSKRADYAAFAKDAAKPLLIIEGELKVACAAKNEFFGGGVGGAYNFGRGNKDLRLHPALLALGLKERPVYICYDSDSIKNPNVMQAENRLAEALLDVGAVVYVMRLPPDGPNKVGADDYIVKHGAAAFQKLMTDTTPWEKSRDLHELNAQYVICRNPASVYEVAARIMHSRTDFVGILEAPRRHTVSRKTKDEDTGEITEKKTTVSSAKEWIEWNQRGEVAGLTYDPGRPIICDGKLNQWADPGIEPLKGSTAPFDELLKHLVPDDKHRAWIMKWAAYPLQHRGARNNTAVTMWGRKEGVGKSLLGETLGWVHGLANYVEVKPQDIEGAFNEWQPRRTFIMGSELCGPTARDARIFEDLLKSMITQTEILVNEKNAKLYRIPNRANHWLTSNRRTAIQLTADARRHFVVHATEEKKPQEFYTRFLAWREVEYNPKSLGLRALLYELLNVDTTDFNPGADAPETEARRAMAKADQSDLQAWAHDLHEDGEDGEATGPRFATAGQLLGKYLLHTPNARTNKQQIAAALEDAGFEQANDGGQIRVGDRKNGKKVRLWVMRDFAKAAKLTAKAIGDEWLKDGGERWLGGGGQ